MAHSVNTQAGLSLVAKAPLALLLFSLLLTLCAFVLPVSAPLIGISLFAGALCAAMLLRYWLGKGGVYFIVGLLVPLLSIMFTPIAQFTDLAQWVLAYFTGFWALLSGYKFYQAKQA